MFNGKIHYKLPFSIANCQITRGYLLNPSPTQLEVSPQPSRVPTDESVADLGGSCGGFLSMFPVLLPKRRSPIEHLDQYSLRFRLFVNEHPYTPANKCVYIYYIIHMLYYIYTYYIYDIYIYIYILFSGYLRLAMLYFRSFLGRTTCRFDQTGSVSPTRRANSIVK